MPKEFICDDNTIKQTHGIYPEDLKSCSMLSRKYKALQKTFSGFLEYESCSEHYT